MSKEICILSTEVGYHRADNSDKRKNCWLNRPGWFFWLASVGVKGSRDNQLFGSVVCEMAVILSRPQWVKDSYFVVDNFYTDRLALLRAPTSVVGLKSRIRMAPMFEENQCCWECNIYKTSEPSKGFEIYTSCAFQVHGHSANFVLFLPTFIGLLCLHT